MLPPQHLAVLGLGLLAVGGVACAVRGRLRLGLIVQAAGAALLGLAGTAVLLGADAFGAGFRSTPAPAIGIDALSGFFLLLLALVAVPACVCARDSLPSGRGGAALGCVTALFVAALAGVVVARDVVTFIGAWELMTLAPAAAILIARHDAEGRRTVFVYLAITHLGGVGVWLALLVLAGHGALGGVPLPAGGTATLVLIAATIGFATKAGLVPLHAWLPRAHPLAPSHVSALMSGAMVAIALYGLIRVLFEWVAPPPAWVGALLLAAGLVSALAGILHAVVQRDLKRMLALSTIENVGIATLGLGAALLLERAGDPAWSAIAFSAALLCLLSHALVKGLLFLCAGTIAGAVGSVDLGALGGLGARMPWTGGAFALAALGIAGVPPLAGFVAEWTLLQSLLHVALAGPGWMVLPGALAVAGLAATAAVALLCFVKAIGLVLLGQPRRPECADAREAPAGTRAALTALAACAVALALVAGPLLGELAELGPGTAPAVALGLDLPGTGGLPVVALTLALLAAVAACGLLAGRGRRAAPAPAWACGQPVGPELAWTPGGFTKLLTLTTAALLRPRRELVVERSERAGAVRRVSHSSEVPRLLDGALYAPILRAALAAATRARRLQSGSLRAYLIYLLALVAGLLALVRTGVLG